MCAGADPVTGRQRYLRAIVDTPDERRARDKQQSAEDERSAELTRWHADDTARAAAARQADQLRHALAD